MANTPKLSTTVQKERKLLSFVPGRITFRPKGSRTVQLDNGGFAQMDTQPLFYETEGEHRMSMVGRLLDPDVPNDMEILAAAEQMLIEKPWMATDVRYLLSIHGEYTPIPPWGGYDNQTAAEAYNTYYALPDVSRPALDSWMKYELERVFYDEDLDEEVSITDDEKVKMINKIAREVEKLAMADADEAVDLT